MLTDITTSTAAVSIQPVTRATLHLKLDRIVSVPTEYEWFRSLPGGGAVIAGHDSSHQYAVHVFDGEKWSPLAAPGFEDADTFKVGGPTLFRAGPSGFGLVNKDELGLWSSLDAPLKRFAMTETPADSFGRRSLPKQGGVSTVIDAPVVVASERAQADSYIYPLVLELEGSQARVPIDSGGELMPVRRSDFTYPPHFDTPTFERAQPQIHDVAWDGERLLAFTVGLNPNWVRWGMAWSTLSRVDVTTGAATHLFTIEEGHTGVFASSLEYLLLQPQHQNGVAKGKPSVVSLASNAHLALVAPRGFAKARVVEHDGTYFWLKNPRATRGSGNNQRYMRCVVR